MSLPPLSGSQASAAAMVRDPDNGQAHAKRVKITGEFSEAGVSAFQAALVYQQYTYQAQIQSLILLKGQVEVTLMQARSSFNPAGAVAAEPIILGLEQQIISIQGELNRLEGLLTQAKRDIAVALQFPQSGGGGQQAAIPMQEELQPAAAGGAAAGGAAAPQAAQANQPPQVYFTSQDVVRDNRLPFYGFAPPPIDQIKEAAQLSDDPLFALLLDYQGGKAQFDAIVSLLSKYEGEGILAKKINKVILGWSPIALVIYQIRDKDLLILLNEAGADLDIKVGSFGLLHLACIPQAAKPAFDVGIQMLVEAGLKVNRGTDCAPLHVAAYYRSVEAFRALVAAGADVNAKDRRKLAALHYVTADEGSPILSELQRCQDVDVNIRGGLSQFTPMMLGALFGAQSSVKGLGVKNALYGVKDSNGLRAIDYARLNGGAHKQQIEAFISGKDRNPPKDAPPESVRLFRL